MPRSKSFRVKLLVEYLKTRPNIVALVDDRVFYGPVVRDKGETYIVVGLADENPGIVSKDALIDIRVVGLGTKDSLMNIIDVITDEILTDTESNPLASALSGFSIHSIRESGGPRTFVDELGQNIIIKDFTLSFLK